MSNFDQRNQRVENQYNAEVINVIINAPAFQELPSTEGEIKLLTIKSIAKKSGWFVVGDKEPSGSKLLISKLANGQLPKDLIRIDLLENDMIVFAKPALRLYNEENLLDMGLIIALLYQNSNNKGFWSVSSFKPFGKLTLALYFCRQIYFNLLDTDTFNEIVSHLESEHKEVEPLFNRVF
jgi:hypothetical protein